MNDAAGSLSLDPFTISRLTADFRKSNFSVFFFSSFFSLLSCGLLYSMSHQQFLFSLPPELALKRLTAADPAWVARLSLPLTSSYKDNVFSPDSPHSPQDEDAARQEQPRTFETFGKGAGADSNAAGTRLASTFLSEMSTLFEMILSQKVQVHNETGSGLLRQLSARGKSLGLEDGAPVL